MNKNICYVVRSLKAAGAEKYVLDVATHFSNNYNVSIITLGSIDHNFISKYPTKQFCIRQFNITGFFALQTLISFISICIFILRHNITLVHTNMFTSDIIGGLAAIFTGRRFISTQHDTQLWRYSTNIKDTIRRSMHRFLMYYTRAIITPTQSVKKYLYDTEKIPFAKMQTIYHGIDLKQFSVKPKKKTNTIIIGSLARFRPEKGHEYIIRALPPIIKKIQNKQLEILFAGEGMTKDRMRKLTEDMHVNKYITFLGHVHDVPGFLQKIDILVHAAVSGEAFCYAALEGLAAGKAVIVTEIDGLPEFIKDHYNGILVPIHSSEAIANAILEVITDRNLHTTLSRNARNSCVPFFSINRMLQQTAQLYSTIFTYGY